MLTDIDVDPRAFSTVRIRSCSAVLRGELGIPPGARGVVVLVHGSGDAPIEQRTRWMATDLQWNRFATLLVDLDRNDEAVRDEPCVGFRADLEVLVRRLTDVVDWVAQAPETRGLAVGILGGDAAAAAALVASARRPSVVRAVVSYSGRPDLAERSLPAVKAPALFVVAGNDPDVLVLNRSALGYVACECAIEVVPGAARLFAEPGARECVAALAREWFLKHLQAGVPGSRSDRMNRIDGMGLSGSLPFGATSARSIALTASRRRPRP